MNIAEIQKRVDALSTAMLAKGLRTPEVTFALRSHQDFQLYLCWLPLKSTRLETSEYEFFRETNPEQAFKKAESFVASMPERDEARFKEFVTALGGVIDLGKENGIEVEFLNPLTATMKKLSENALMKPKAEARA